MARRFLESATFRNKACFVHDGRKQAAPPHFPHKHVLIAVDISCLIFDAMQQILACRVDEWIQVDKKSPAFRGAWGLWQCNSRISR
jgi:hypothetical protein